MNPTPLSIRLGEAVAKRKKWLVTVATFLAGETLLLQQHVTGALFWVSTALLVLNSFGVHQVTNDA